MVICKYICLQNEESSVSNLLNGTNKMFTKEYANIHYLEENMQLGK